MLNTGDIVRQLLLDEQLVKVHFVDNDVLWECLRTLAKMVVDAKPIVESDARMMADISRHSPLPPESQVTHDTTEYPSEIWLEQFKKFTEQSC